MSTLALIRLVADCARHVGAAENTYVVGGAPRDCLLGQPVKDIDVVVEDLRGEAARAIANVIAQRVGLREVHPDQYGVVHVGPFPRGARHDEADLQGEKVEIVTARSEKYDKSLRTGSHKPAAVRPGSLYDDLRRRDFTFNTLAWRVADVPARGTFDFHALPIVDKLGGRADLSAGVIRTPLNPRLTFEEDPSRMLRAVRFAARFDFRYAPSVEDALGTMADEMRRLPYEVLDGVLCGKIITLPRDRASRALADLSHLGLLRVCLEQIPESRLRRVVDAVGDVHMRLLLLRHGFPSALRGKLSEQHFQWLFDAEQTESTDRLNDAMTRFVRPPVDVQALAAEKGLTGEALGRAVSLAREMLLPDPFVEGPELHRRVAAAL